MTTPDLKSGHENWQVLYSSTESRWQDLGRIAVLVLPVAGLIVLATLYAVVGYVYIFFDHWALEVSSELTRTLLLLKIAGIIVAPLLAVIMGLWFVFRQTRGFVLNYYQPGEDQRLGPLIRRRLLGVLPLPPPLDMLFKYPFLVIKKPFLAEDHW